MILATFSGKKCTLYLLIEKCFVLAVAITLNLLSYNERLPLAYFLNGCFLKNLLNKTTEKI